MLIRLTILALLTACAGNPQGFRAVTSQPYALQDKSGSDEIDELISEVNSEIKEKESPVEKQSPIVIPLEINERVQRWIKYFMRQDHDRFQRFVNRAERYREVVSEILDREGVPRELFYVGIIESGYQTNARSHANAVGPWQFISATGRRYNLKHNYYVDERRDIMRATEAAARYLKDLHNVFNSWYLALAAYNAGEMRILNAIMKANSRDFWALAEKRALPRETMNYIPKFLAAAIIGHHPEKFGFEIEADEDFPELRAVAVPGAVRLTTISKKSGISVAEIKKYNPHLRRSITPPGKSYNLWIKESRAGDLEDSHSTLKKYVLKGLSAPNTANVHRVRRGETLGRIARKYRTSVARLKAINNLRTSRIYSGQKLKVSGSSVKKYKGKKKARRYRVRRGDNLTSIARKFNVSLSQLKRFNRLKRDRIVIGQLLTVGYRRM